MAVYRDAFPCGSIEVAAQVRGRFLHFNVPRQARYTKGAQLAGKAHRAVSAALLLLLHATDMVLACVKNLCSQRFQVVDDDRMRDRGIGAAARLGDVGVRLGQSLDMRLVDNGVGVPPSRRAVHTQSKNGLMTTALGMLAAESSSLRLSGSPKL